MDEHRQNCQQEVADRARDQHPQSGQPHPQVKFQYPGIHDHDCQQIDEDTRQQRHQTAEKIDRFDVSSRLVELSDNEVVALRRLRWR